jgi:hypothetical protein
MNEIRLKSESELMAELLKSNHYKKDKERHFPHKVERERKAWQLLQKNRGNYTQEILNNVFDTVDTNPNGKGWFGQLLAAPNRNLIFQTSPKALNEWLEELLFSGHKPENILNHCLKERKVKGAHKGLATLFLYLSDPEHFNVWVNSTEEGLVVLGRIVALKGDWGAKYTQFNKAALDFRDAYKLKPQEMDWMLTTIGHFVKSEGEQFLLSKDDLEHDVQVTVDGEQLDPVQKKGPKMELGLMNSAPTNEMEVVALFVEYRMQLGGFRYIETIRQRFPDAIVLQESKNGIFVVKRIEFEFHSKTAKNHRNLRQKCDYVICWENNWKDCPVPVIELKTEIPKILSRAASTRKSSPTPRTSSSV